MKRVAAAFLLLSGISLLFIGLPNGRTKSVHAYQISPVGAPAPQMRDSLPACNSTLDGVQFWARATGISSTCDANTSAWINPPYASTAPVAFYSNGTLQSPTTKCGYATGTSSAAGSFTFNPSTALGGITTIIGAPQPTVTAAANTSANVTLQTGYTATSATVFVQTASIISVVGINVTLFSNAALPVSIFLCGR